MIAGRYILSTVSPAVKKSVKKNIKEIILEKIIDDKDISEREGDFFDASDYKIILTEDCDVYRKDDITGKKVLLLSFRKNVIKKNICNDAYLALEKEAKLKHSNRGAAAGKLNSKKLPAYVKKIVNRQKYRGYYMGADGKIRKDHISNLVSSGIIGYYDKPDRNLMVRKTKKSTNKPIEKCRMTKFTKSNPTKWAKCLPLLRSVDRLFKSLVPEAHKEQLDRASLTPKFQIEDTAFSTATINYDYTTALHRDKGDYNSGFGNLVVLEKSMVEKGVEKYEGGFTGFPQYGVAVDARHGDFVAMDVHQWHCNTSIVGNGRLSVVCYLRSGMLKCAEN